MAGVAGHLKGWRYTRPTAVSRTTVLINNRSVPVVIEDWYKLVVSAQRSVTLSLSFESSRTSDVDLYVFTDSTRGPQLFKYSVADNVDIMSFNETVSARQSCNNLTSNVLRGT